MEDFSLWKIRIFKKTGILVKKIGGGGYPQEGNRSYTCVSAASTS